MVCGLWGIVNETEAVEANGKFMLRRDRALAIIGHLSLLYLVGTDPEDPVEVWKDVGKQTRAAKESLSKKSMFEELAVIDDVVVHLLASLPVTSMDERLRTKTRQGN